MRLMPHGLSLMGLFAADPCHPVLKGCLCGHWLLLLNQSLMFGGRDELLARRNKNAWLLFTKPFTRLPTACNEAARVVDGFSQCPIRAV